MNVFKIVQSQCHQEEWSTEPAHEMSGSQSFVMKTPPSSLATLKSGDATGVFWATTCDLLPGQSTIAGLRHGRHGLMPTGAAVKQRCSGRNRNARHGRNGDRATYRRGFKL